MKRVLTAIVGVVFSILMNPLALAADEGILPGAPRLYEYSVARSGGAEWTVDECSDNEYARCVGQLARDGEQSENNTTLAKKWPTKLELATTALTDRGTVSAFVEPEAALANSATAGNLAKSTVDGSTGANLTAVASNAGSTVGAVANYNVSIIIPTRAEYVATSQNLSYGDIYRFKKLVYAHNTAGLFGNLGNLTPGSAFTLTEGGVTRTYRVAAQAMYANTAAGLDGDETLMERIVYSALGHSVALMTCAGTPYGNGNATERLVVYGDEI